MKEILQFIIVVIILSANLYYVYQDYHSSLECFKQIERTNK